MTSAAQGVIVSTTLARLEDKLVLCSSSSSTASSTTPNYRDREQTLLHSLHQHPGVAQSATNQDRALVTVDSGDTHRFYVLIDWAQFKVVYFTLCTKTGNPNQQAVMFSYLESLAREFGVAYSPDQVRAVQSPYAMIKFDSFMTKAARTAERQLGQNSAQALSQQLSEVQNIIRTNLEDMVMRGEKLSTMTQYSAELKEHSGKFKHKTAKLNKTNWLAVGAGIGGGMLMLLLLYWILL
eukprot:PhF_6_TR42387/c0_g1_i1/m.63940/K08517/SEC22; vesicle transport protein SEC22